MFVQEPRFETTLGLGVVGNRVLVSQPPDILAFTDTDKVALNVGFYYMANAGGRLVGSLLSGFSYQLFGLTGCLLTAAALIAIAGALTVPLGAARRSRTPVESDPL